MSELLTWSKLCWLIRKELLEEGSKDNTNEGGIIHA